MNVERLASLSPVVGGASRGHGPAVRRRYLAELSPFPSKRRTYQCASPNARRAVGARVKSIDHAAPGEA